MRNVQIIFLLATMMISMTSDLGLSSYDKKFVQVSTSKYNGHSYKVIYMGRGLSGNRIKAKYFAAKDYRTNRSVPERLEEWSRGMNLICVTSGTYMDEWDPTLAKPVGLTVDNGVVVNNALDPKMDGLVIVYATGGVVATNIDDKDLTVQGGSISGQKLDLRNGWHRTQFLKWCEEKEATVFQTHLLVYKNENKVSSSNSNPDSRERRFLAVGKDEDGEVVHCIVHSPEHTSLYQGTKRVREFLIEFKDMEIIFMVNLDTGAQDVFNLWKYDGDIDATITGQLPHTSAVNLLVYYYE